MLSAWVTLYTHRMGNTFRAICHGKRVVTKFSAGDLFKNCCAKESKVSELCRRWSISRKTAYKWIARFKERGRYGLADRRRAARRVHNRPTDRGWHAFGAGLAETSQLGSAQTALGTGAAIWKSVLTLELGLTRLSAWWVKLGIKVEFIEPRRPEQNGAHEQLHRVYHEEVAQPAAWSLRAQRTRSRRWLRHYNYERPHEALGMRVPTQLYRKSPRPMPKHLKHWQYESGWETRLVKGKGMISLNGRGRFIGEARTQADQSRRLGSLFRAVAGWRTLGSRPSQPITNCYLCGECKV